MTKRKYRNKPKVVDGRWFASRREARRYAELKLLEQAGEISHLKMQVRFPLSVNGERICTYIADFTYRTPTGEDVIEDVKGVRTPVYRLKSKLLWALYGIRIREV